MAGVALVERSTKQHIDRAPSSIRATPAVGSSSRDLLGLDGPGGVWAGHGGPERAGRGVVVGVVDTGIWPENPSFSGLPQRTPGTAPQVPGFHGACDPAEEWSAETARTRSSRPAGSSSGFGEENVAAAEYLSPRDGTGHGSHVASTAAGDNGVRVEVDGQRFGTTSGMAPAARLAVYKACWTAPDPAQDGCTTADTVAAVDAAVADGVDVLNYSVSGSDRLDDSVERALPRRRHGRGLRGRLRGQPRRRGRLGRARLPLGHHGRGQHPPRVPGRRPARRRPVSTSARWSPTSRCAPHRSCSAPTSPRRGRTPTRPGSASRAPSTPPRRRAGSSSATAATAPGSTSPRTVSGAGGAGMVLVNTRHQSTDADVHAVPTVHLDAAEGAARQGLRPARRRRRHGRPRPARPHRRRRACARRLLRPRPRSRRRRRRAQARPDRPGRQRARRGRAAVGLGPLVGPGVRYVDQRTARRGARRVRRGRAPRLVPVPGEVGHDDHRLRPAGPPRRARRGRRARRPALVPRPRPGVRHPGRRLAGSALRRGGRHAT